MTSLLVLTSDEAAALAESRPGWYFVPCTVMPDGRGNFKKVPLAMWTAEAATGGPAVHALWESKGRGKAGVAVVTRYSGIVVLDEDHSDYDQEIRKFLDGLDTLTLLSCTKARPHWYFLAEEDAEGRSVVSADGAWEGGDVKATGLVFLSAEPPLLDAEIKPVSVLFGEGSPFHGLKMGGTSGAGRCSKEEMRRWLESTPDDADLLVEEDSQDAFITTVVEKVRDKVEGGAHRRQAMLDGVYQAAIEASAGLYGAQNAFDALADLYRELRSVDGTDTSLRQRDWWSMWQTLVPKIASGQLDDAIEACRDGARERGLMPDDDPAVEHLIALVRSWDESNGDIGALTPTPIATLRDRLTEEPLVGVDRGWESRDDADGFTSWSAEDVAEASVGISVAAVEAPASFVAAEPTLSNDALWGPHGELVEALRGKHEVSDVGILAGLLTEAGILLSCSAHWSIGGVDTHTSALFVNVVGPSGIGRKSHAMNIAQAVFEPVGVSLVHGVRREKCKGSGEYLVHKMWPIPVVAAGEDPDPLPDKRVLFRMPEVSMLWKKSRSDGSTMAETFCEMWDQNDLEAGSLTSGSAKVKRTDYVVGSYGSSTDEVSKAAVASSLDSVSGFGNRFLWFWLPDSGVDLPDGDIDIGHLPEVARYRERFGWVTAPVCAASTLASWSPEARELWRSVYGNLKREKGSSGLVKGLNGRAEPYVKRLALGYQLSVGSSPVVGVEALKAALAVWSYCRDSVEYLFGGLALEKRHMSDEEALRIVLAERPMMTGQIGKECGWNGSVAKRVLAAAAHDGLITWWNIARPGEHLKKAAALTGMDVEKVVGEWARKI